MDTTHSTLVQTFVDFYRERGHQPLPGDSLIAPPGDPVLFTTAGMHHLTPYLEGRPHPLGNRLVGSQRCLRTTDLDEVGDRSHLTVFEMLGTWSLGDYDGEQSLRWGFELLRDGFGLRPGSLHATVFGGDDVLGPDTESLEVWQDLGVPVEPTRGEENWWSNGPTGPCGPDSEIFVWTGDGIPSGTPTTDPRWVEIWNHVMMRYRRHDDGTLTPLPQRNIDTGLGLDRLATVLQGADSVYGCDIFASWREVVTQHWDLDEREQRIVMDHLRSCIAIIGDCVLPASGGRGYVLRRLLRRVLTILWREGRPSFTLGDLPIELFAETLDHFHRLDFPGGPETVRSVVTDEERRFVGLCERGRRVLSRFSGSVLSEEDYSFLHETHGLPREIVDLLRRQENQSNELIHSETASVI
ncbi:alanine--tRNA ligase-related protein [Actinospica robiniae]|uniref:alanine--tRNA ligase-related protein n=1 Tax=Actinospica robiniae TaxID=304901 RepID=UPI00040580C1|nr:alanine--tRNA ligase-related protein [Actinospica robiniae]